MQVNLFNLYKFFAKFLLVICSVNAISMYQCILKKKDMVGTCAFELADSDIKGRTWSFNRILSSDGENTVLLARLVTGP